MCVVRLNMIAFIAAPVAGSSRFLRLMKSKSSRVKKLSPRRITSSPVTHANVVPICELDEQRGALFEVKPGSTGSGMRKTPKMGAY